MSSITLSLQIACTREEAARFAAVELFLAELERDSKAEPSAELDAVFGANPKTAILGLVGHPEPLGISCQFDRHAGVLTLTATDGHPNLAALRVLLLWLYPDKLPIAYSVHVTERPDHTVWTIVGMSHSGVTGISATSMRSKAPSRRRANEPAMTRWPPDPLGLSCACHSASSPANRLWNRRAMSGSITKGMSPTWRRTIFSAPCALTISLISPTTTIISSRER